MYTKKSVTESEHIRSLLQKISLTESPNRRRYYPPGHPDAPEQYFPPELLDFQTKIYNYQKDFENLLQDADSNPSRALNIFKDTAHVTHEIEDIANDLFHPLLDKFWYYIEDQTGEEEPGYNEPTPKTKAELKKLIQTRISILNAANNFIEKNSYEIADHIIDNYDDDNF